MPKVPQIGNVVRDYMIGNTRVRICDDYCRDKTPEDVDRILRRIARNALPYLVAQELEKEAAQKSE